MPIDLESSDSDLVAKLKDLNKSLLLDDYHVPGYYQRDYERKAEIRAVRFELARRLGITLNPDGSARE